MGPIEKDWARLPVNLLVLELPEGEAIGPTLEVPCPGILPSEEALVRQTSEGGDLVPLPFQQDRPLLRRLNLGSLLPLSREGGRLPRWFLYDPLCPCDTVIWGTHARITFEMVRDSRVLHRVTTPFENPFPHRLKFLASPLLLPSRIRGKILSLNKEREIRPYILFQPRVIKTMEVPHPAPALLEEKHGTYWLADSWEDPAFEGHRALDTLRDFYVCTKTPDWLRHDQS